MIKSLKLLLLFLAVSATYASKLDVELQNYIARFQFKPVPRPTGINRDIYNLGKKLFSEVEISGNRNISCASCHDPKLGTSDALPLSLGEDGKTIIARNSPALFNLDHPEMRMLFWDGRVSYDERAEAYTTPSEVLNGDYPERWDITDELGSALAAQALFPILNHEEMRGQKGTNEIADAKSDEEAWERIMRRLLGKKEYQELFKKAFPKAMELNIGHLGNALAHFQKFEFSSTNTPWDRYLRGQIQALSEAEKRGAIIFSTKGRCIVCHGRTILGGNAMANIAAPQIGPGKDIRNNDQGRFEVTNEERHRYVFRAPPLRNVALTAPYFHSGAYETLMDVVNHYAGGIKSLDEYNSKWLEKFEKTTYKQKIYVETNHYRLFRKKEDAHPVIKRNMIRLTQSEKEDLVLFLTKSLTDPKFESLKNKKSLNKR
ncbi:cytochrome-c peroxidase [Bacteriovorax sp. DB6_IX]|uniref:cytochrome-c peroxidase n=1 Tax=Bacteriovorax sp. DB6_IX TaxID=1353530 RepID=UPI00038A3C8C|nr:cytochrome c peroxidase [Bacteriovorax sp. DB6_IX]EQC50492.1 di-heme cytochrome C peroxidase [Bacteriovorax sp. DB6_IX]